VGLTSGDLHLPHILVPTVALLESFHCDGACLARSPYPLYVVAQPSKDHGFLGVESFQRLRKALAKLSHIVGEPPVEPSFDHGGMYVTTTADCPCVPHPDRDAIYDLVGQSGLFPSGLGERHGRKKVSGGGSRAPGTEVLGREVRAACLADIVVDILGVDVNVLPMLVDVMKHPLPS
jgi:hypothetical protein